MEVLDCEYTQITGLNGIENLQALNELNLESTKLDELPTFSAHNSGILLIKNSPLEKKLKLFLKENRFEIEKAETEMLVWKKWTDGVKGFSFNIPERGDCLLRYEEVSGFSIYDRPKGVKEDNNKHNFSGGTTNAAHWQEPNKSFGDVDQADTSRFVALDYCDYYGWPDSSAVYESDYYSFKPSFWFYNWGLGYDIGVSLKQDLEIESPTLEDN